MSEEPEQRESGRQQRSPKRAEVWRLLRGWSALPRRAMHRHALLLLWLGTLALMLAVIALQAALYLEGPQWHERVRQFAAERLEQATGGRVELQQVDWSLHRLQFGLSGLRIHGTEAEGEAPLLELERAQVQLKWSELLAGRFELQQLLLLRPRVHVRVYADGSTNLPPRKQAGGAVGAEQLLWLAVEKAELTDGWLDWNDEKIRLDGTASGVFVRLGYQASDRHYEGSLRIKQARLRMPEKAPFDLAVASEFRLYRDRVEVSRLRVDEQHGWLELSGKISGLASPEAQFAYRASCETDELARLLGDRHMHGGRLQASGRGSYHWKDGKYALTGNARASQVGWDSEGVRLNEVSGGMNFSLQPEGVKISNLFAVTLGGTVYGNVELTTPTGKEKTSAGQVDLKLAGVDLERILEAFSTEQLPLRRLLLAGSTDGTLAARWKGELSNAQMDGNLRVSPLYRPGRLPLTATVQAAVDFREATVQVRQLEARTRATHLSLQGRLSRNSDFNLTVDASSLAELEPMVVAWRGSRAEDLPIEFSGRAFFRGTVQGPLRDPAVDGHLELHDFTTNVLVPSLPGAEGAQAAEQGGEKQAAAPRRLRTQWDLLQGEVHFSEAGESLRHGILRRGDTEIGVDVTLGLAAGAYSRSRPFTARVKLRDASVDDLQELLGSHYPVKGNLSGEMELSGAAGSLSGTGRMTLRDGEAWNQPVRMASAEIELTEKQAQLRNIVLTSDAARLTGEAWMKLATREFSFRLRGSAVKLEEVRALQARKVPLRGRASFEVTGKGTPDAPEFNGLLQLRELVVGKLKVGAMDVQAVTHGTEMTLTAHSQFSHADLKVAGQVHLRGEMPMRLRADLHSANLEALLADYLPVRLPAASELKLHAEISGDAKHPGNLAAEITIERVTSSFGAILVANESPIRLKLEEGVLRVVELRLAGEKGSHFLRVRGTVQLQGEQQIHLQADGSVNLKLLQTLEPDLMASGEVRLRTQITGTLKQPKVQGRLKVQDGTIAYIDFPNGLSDINGSLIFTEDRLQLQDLTARTGGGLLQCSGFLSYVPSQGLGFNLAATGKDIRLRYPEGLSSSADANLMLSGTTKHALLSGDIVITRLGVNRRFDFASYLAKGRRAAPAQTTESPLNNVRLDVHVTSTPELQVQTSLARLSGNLDLRLRGTAFRPVVLGRVNIVEGTLEFNGTKYNVERGDITFANPVRIEPNLDVELSARVRDYDVTLGLHGPLNKLTTSYRSDPPLSSSDIISLLALGHTAQEQANPAVGTAQYQPSISESASNALLGQALNATVSSRVQKLFGVSRLKIDPNVGGAVNTALARVTVEQQISNKLTLTYITNLSQSAQQIIQFEYNVNKGLKIVGVRDQNGVVSFDVVLRKRIK